jgi:hypothetical protein
MAGLPPNGVPRPGEVLLGKYRVERVLGIGGMGVVVAATHIQLEDRFAIKLLLPQSAAHPDLVRRFIREGQAATRIRSEHVVRVFDVGVLETGAPYMAMEYLDGQDLAATVARGGALPVPVAVDFLLQACEAIAEAHALGIVHRDLKPANLFVTRRVDGSTCVKVLDFGISKVRDVSGSGADMGMTKTQAVMGSPRYMSPEQMRSTRNVDARADIWALGAIVHELLVGYPVFNAQTMTELCAQILQDAPPPLRRVRPDVPLGIEAAILCCLQKDPAMRFQNVGQLAQAVVEFGPPHARASAERIVRVLESAGIRSVAPPPAMGSVPAAAPGRTSTAWGETGAPVKKRGATIVVLLVAALVAVAGAAVLATVAFLHAGTKAVAKQAASSGQASTVAGPEPPPAPPPSATTETQPGAEASSAAASDSATAAASASGKAGQKQPGKPGVHASSTATAAATATGANGDNLFNGRK